MPFDGHPIHRVSYRNTVSYFLRVPDGSPLGTGYAHTGFQSLKRLADGDNDTLAAVDGSTVYHGWNDLVGTLRGSSASSADRPDRCSSTSPNSILRSIPETIPII